MKLDAVLSRIRPFVAPAAGLFAVALLMMWQANVFATGRVEPGDTPLAPADAADRAVTVASEEIPLGYRAVGTLRSRDEVELSPRIVSRVTEVTARSGDRVKKDEVLIRLDDADLSAAVAQAAERVGSAEAAREAAREQVDSAKAALDLAETELGRMQTLNEKGVAPKSDLDRAISTERQARSAWNRAQENLRGAKSELAAAEQARKQAEARLSYATIRSPMDGVVSDRLADPGDLASPGNILMRIFDPTRLMLETPVRESLVSAVEIGRIVSFRVPAVDATYQGDVREIVPTVDPGSRTFLVKICLGEAPKLMPGMFGTITFPLGRTRAALLVPEGAVTRTGQLEYVRVVTDHGPQRRLVRTIPGPDGRREVVSGLSAGETVALPDPPPESSADRQSAETPQQ